MSVYFSYRLQEQEKQQEQPEEDKQDQNDKRSSERREARENRAARNAMEEGGELVNCHERNDFPPDERRAFGGCNGLIH